MTNDQRLFKRLAIRSLIRSVKKNGRLFTREWADSWNPENPKFLVVWEEAKKEVLR